MARTGRKSTVKFKLHKELVILLAVIVAMIATTIILSIPSNSEKTLEELNYAISLYNSTNSTSYSTLGEDYVYEKVELNDLKKAISSTNDGTEEKAEYESIKMPIDMYLGNPSISTRINEDYIVEDNLCINSYNV